jgi:hypothetical protein
MFVPKNIQFEKIQSKHERIAEDDGVNMENIP